MRRGREVGEMGEGSGGKGGGNWECGTPCPPPPLTQTLDCMHICILTADYIKQSLKKKDKIMLNAGQKDCRMLQGEHSAILSTFIKLPFVIKIFVLSFLSGCLRQILLY